MGLPQPSNSIQQQRSNINYDLEQLNYFIEGSKETALGYRKLMLEVERDPILKIDTSYYEYDKEQHRLWTARKIARLATYMEKDLPNHAHFSKRLEIVSLMDPQLGTRLGVHLGLFLNAVRGNGTEEQFNYWIFERGAIMMKDLYGCFAMTELAHGSNVAGLETTATLDEATNEFIINTPHVGATKWWIGGAAHSANHAVVYARLIVRGTDYGVKTFIVPLRDTNHDIHPGVTIGDIGAKMGRDGIDNGWIQFSNVKIPKEYMLSKFTKIQPDGEVIIPPLEQISYGALLSGRVTMAEESFRTGAKIITIALRYAVGRRQFGAKDNEKQLISYPLHQSRLIPLLAYVYATACGSARLRKDHDETQDLLNEAGRTQDFKTIGIAIEKLKNVFGSSAALKSTCTWFTASLIDECRQSCGGHGYSSYSGFARVYADWVVQCTWEGDNNVLAMNAGRIVTQAYQKAVKGKKIRGDLKFMNDIAKYADNQETQLKSTDDLFDLLEAFKIVIIRYAKQIDTILKSNGNNWDAVGVEKVCLSKLYAHYYNLSSFVEHIESPITETGNIKPMCVKLCQVYALSIINSFNGTFLQFKVFPPSITFTISDQLKNLYNDLQNHVIGLTDAFKLSDFFINSPLGKYDGDIYNNYFNTVRLHNDPASDKAPYNDEFVAMLNRDLLHDRERNEKSPQVLQKLGASSKL